MKQSTDTNNFFNYAIEIFNFTFKAYMLSLTKQFKERVIVQCGQVIQI